MTNQLERVTPESVGIPSEAILQFMDHVQAEGVELHSMMLLRYGKVCAEAWWEPFNPAALHPMYSFSKSLTSTAIGFAVQEGILKTEDRLVDIFREYLPDAVSENLEKATIHDLLIMGCGHETEIATGQTEHWIRDFLAHEFKYEPGTMFQYNTAGTTMLAAALWEKTGQTLTEFLLPRLFEKLGIGDVEMEVLPDGTEWGGGGFKLRTEDMARFIQFVANRGSWRGEQLLDPAWFDRALSCQIATKNSIYENNSPDWLCGYGYQFWRCQPENVYRADGLMGQFGIIMEDQQAVLIMTSSTTRTQSLLQAVWDDLLPRMEDRPLEENPGEYGALKERCYIASLRSLPVSPRCAWSMVSLPEYAGRVYVCPERALRLEALEKLGVDLGEDDGTGETVWFTEEEEEPGARNFIPDLFLHVEDQEGGGCLRIGMKGNFEESAFGGMALAAVGSWRSAGTLEVQVYCVNSVVGARYLFRFDGDEMEIWRDEMPVMAGVSQKAVYTLKK